MDPQLAKIFNSTKKTRGKRPHPLPLKENEGTKEHHSEPTNTVSVEIRFLAVCTIDNSGELSIDFLSIQLPTTCSSKGMLEAVTNGVYEIGFDFETIFQAFN